MRALKVGINGFGRIGRAIYRINDKKDIFKIVAINDINPDIKNMAYLLRYDTTYGRFPKQITHDDSSLLIDGNQVQVYHKKKIIDVPWDSHGVDVVIDCSGVKANLAPMRDSNSGVKHFIITNSPRDFDDFKTIIFGVNEGELDPTRHKLISSSICDTIALSPVIKLITETHDIQSGFLITLHPWLSYQNLLDGPSASWSQPGDIFSHYALGRSSTENIIPKSTSAIVAAESVFPDLAHKIQSFSYRVPTNIVSSAVLILMLDKGIKQSDIIRRFSNYETHQNYKVVCNSMEPLTSIDYLGEEHSVIIDHRWTKVQNDRHVKLVYWYDNEWGYSSRVVDIVGKLSDYYFVQRQNKWGEQDKKAARKFQMLPDMLKTV